MNDTTWQSLVDGCPPPWANGWGQDSYGFFVEIWVKRVTQKMRWIPPGRFLMGSPENEPGRYEDEAPQHEEIIEKGFWLFDTPCTQALWQAVMDDNPSYFQSPDRPVEQVSFEQVQEFLHRINEHHPGLSLSLPSEAAWEYACRAGTTTALYTGNIEIVGAHNAPALDPIAWYGGNSGLGFELENGVLSTKWPEKQYPHEWAGTHPVGLKEPNPWGLYDMLGNVYEWCEDLWRDSYKKTAKDAGTTAGVGRVLRGGSWYDDARHVRAACRYGGSPAVRGHDLGFRCARVQP